MSERGLGCGATGRALCQTADALAGRSTRSHRTGRYKMMRREALTPSDVRLAPLAMATVNLSHPPSFLMTSPTIKPIPRVHDELSSLPPKVSPGNPPISREKRSESDRQ